MSERVVNVTQEFIDLYGWQLREEIVRCRDCRYYEPDGEPSQVYPDRYFCNAMCMFMPPYGFCSWGERKSNWLTCKCGERIEKTDGGFAVCPSCGRKVKGGD